MMEGNSIGTKWGNKFGLFLLPIHCHTKSGENPLENVKKAKKMLDRKKQSLEAHFSYKTGKLAMSLFGPKVSYLTLTNQLNFYVLTIFCMSLAHHAHAKKKSLPCCHFLLVVWSSFIDLILLKIMSNKQE